MDVFFVDSWQMVCGMSLIFKSIVLLLSIFYSFVLNIALNPKVSDAYREYYISKTTSLSPTERKKFPPLEIGKFYSHQTDAIGFDGWSNAEENYRWNSRNSVRIIFRLKNTLLYFPKKIVLHVVPFRIQMIRWSLNSGKISDVIVKEEMDLTLSLENSRLYEGENILYLNLPDARRADNRDQRFLAIALKSFRLE